ncbi:MAG TPA: O-antigen ligase family protein [Pyrinomonadaceae bacterium]|nr:O-antigen ligase family protein [Pyrinomonadaceae bacterium]
MSSVVQIQSRPQPRSALIWLPVQAAIVFSVIAVTSGGQMLRTWILGALVWVMALPLLVSLEAGLVGMMLFEPLRGVIRRAQYLFLDYSASDPIHLLTPIVALLAFTLLLNKRGLEIFRQSRLAPAVSLLLLIYFIQIFNPLQGGLVVGLSGALFMLVPVLWFYFGQAAKSDFLRTALRLMVVMGLITSLYGVYQLVFGLTSFDQFWLDHSEYNNWVRVAGVVRAMATYANAEEWSRYLDISALGALGLAVIAKRYAHRIAWFACGMLLFGALILSGQRVSIFGFFLGSAILLLSGARTRGGIVRRAALVLIPALLIFVFAKPPAEGDQWEKEQSQAVESMVSHSARGVLQPTGEGSLYARFENWGEGAKVILYRPFGLGIGAATIPQARNGGEGDNLPATDSYILSATVACGIPAGLLCLWIFGHATLISWRAFRRAAPDSHQSGKWRVMLAIMPVLAFINLFGYSFLLVSVAPVGWLLIGWVSAEPEREIITL